MSTKTEEEGCARLRRWQAAEEACRSGDLDALRAALGDPEGFPDCVLAIDFHGLADRPLDLAIGLGPPALVDRLLDLGADPCAAADDGFPPLFAAIDAPRPDRHAILAILLARGAEPEQRGLNDGTALHHAVARRDLEAVRLLLAHGADPTARTRIDDCSTPIEDAEAAGFDEAASLMRAAMPASRRRGPEASGGRSAGAASTLTPPHRPASKPAVHPPRRNLSARGTIRR